jgi:hypothetical protein
MIKSPRVKTWLMIGGGVLVGFAASSLIMRPRAPTKPARPEGNGTTMASHSTAVDPQALRAIIRDEVSGALAQTRPLASGQTNEGDIDAPKTEPANPDTAPRTEQQVQAYSRAETLIAERMSAGAWRTEDEANWRMIATELNSADFATLRLQILAAHNQEVMKIDPAVWRPGKRRSH